MNPLRMNQAPRRARRIFRPGWAIPAIIAAVALVGVAFAAAPNLKKLINLGTPDDPYMVDQNAPQTMTASVASEQSAAVVNPVSLISIGSIDPSLFPRICTWVSALDPGGIPVPHLPADSFCVYQDGFRMNSFTIQEQRTDSCRTSTCLVIDVSGSMSQSGKITAARDAARRFVRAMTIYDRTAIVKFSDCYTVVQNFTSDTTLLINAIGTLSANGTTAYFDGVWKGVGLTTTELGSKAVIALTDGLENNSQNCDVGPSPNGLNNGFTDDSTLIVNLALGAGIPIFNITLGTSFDTHYSVSLSNGTGGAHFHAPTGAQLDSLYDAIKVRLCTRYLICYNSIDTIPNGDCHTVVVCHRNGDATCSPCDTGTYCEKAPPIIKRTPPTIALDNTCQKPKTNVQLCAWVTDKDTPLASLTVNLFYRNSGISSYTSVATTRTDSTFCATVPSAQLLCTGDSIQYYFTASDGEHTVASPSTAPVGHHAFPICPTNANAGPDKVLTCALTQVNLAGSSTTAGVTFAWVASGGGHIVSGATTATPLVDAAGTYALTVTDPSNTCTGKDTALVTANTTKPNVSAGPDKVLTCTVTQVNLAGSSSTGGATFGWATSSGGHIVSGGSTATPLVDAAGTYVLTVTNPANGCIAIDTALVTSNATPPNASAGPDKVLTCTVTQINLAGSSSTGGATFAWVASVGGHIVSGATTATPLVDAAGTYVLTVTNPANGCTAKDTALVTSNTTPPNANAGPDKVLTCTVTQVNLAGSSSTGGATFAWIASAGGHIVSGATTATPLVDAAGTYALTVTNPANGCTAKDTALVTANLTPPNANAGPDKVLTCTVTQINLAGSSSTGGAIFAWVASAGGHIVSGATTATPLVDAAGTYTLTVTNPANGCSATDIAIVTFDPDRTPPEMACPVNVTVACDQPTDTAHTGSATASDNCGGTPKIDYVDSLYGGPCPQTFTIVRIWAATDVAGNVAHCRQVISVVDNKAPICHVPNDTTIFVCESKEICLPVWATDACDPAVTCTQTSGVGTIVNGKWCYTADHTIQTFVGVRCTDACGNFCEGRFRVLIIVNSPPTIAFGNDTTVNQCSTEPICVTYTVSDPNGPAWLTETLVFGPPGATMDTLLNKICFTPSGSGKYTIIARVTDSCGAFDNDTIVVTVDGTKPELSCKGDELTCDSLQATASVVSSPSTGVSYLWSPAPLSGQGTAFARYDTPGSKKVVVTIPATGCKDSCEATITQNIRQPELSCDADTITCARPQVTASVKSSPNDGVSYLWDPLPLSGQGTSQAQYNTPGPKQVIVTIQATGCKDTCTVNVQQNLTMPKLTCTGDELTCDSTDATASLTFEFGQSKIPFPLTFFWTPAPLSGQGTQFAHYNTPGVKKVVVTYVPSGCKDSCEATITQNVTKPELSCVGDTLTCDQVVGTASVTSSITQGVSYNWDPFPLSGQGTPHALYNSPGTKKVVVMILATGCKDSCEAVISQIITKPTLSCTGDELTCDSLLATASVTSTPSLGVSYTWIPVPVSGQGTPFARYDTPGKKKVIVTIQATGCKDSCDATITENIRPPELQCDADTITCAKPQATATVYSLPSAGVSYTWSPEPVSGQGTSQAQYDTPGAKHVVVKILATGCTNVCTVNIQRNLTMPALTCIGDQLTCDSTDATASVTFEFGQSKIPFPLTFFWTPAPLSGQGTQFAHYNTPGVKKVVVTYVPSGCKDSCEATITQNIEKPVLSCTGDHLTCDSLLGTASVSFDDQANSKATAVFGYFWSPSPISGQGTPFARYDTPGQKKVVVTILATGCKDSCEATITQDIEKPSLSCTGDALTCDSLLATASVSFETRSSKSTATVTYFWTPAPVSGQGTPWARYDTPGTKKVVVTFGWNGCKDSCEATITQNIEKPQIRCTGDELTCDSLLASATVELVPTGSKTVSPYSFLWTPAPVTGQGTQWARYNTPGMKKVVVTYLPTGCKDSCEAEITQSATKPLLSCTGDELTCDSLLASATVTFPGMDEKSPPPSPYSYFWTPAPVSGQGTPFARYSSPGNKKVVVTYLPTGCKDSCEATITQSIDKPLLSCTGDELTCDSTMASATVAFVTAGKIAGAVSYLWTPAPVSGQGTPFARYNAPGNKKVVVTYLSTGCKDSCEATITQDIFKPELQCTGDQLTCDSTLATASVQLPSGSKTLNGFGYFWTPAPVSGQGTAFARYSTPGNKKVVVTFLATGCKDSCEAVVTQDVFKPLLSCTGDELTCDSTLATASVVWEDASNKSVIGVTYLWTPAPVSGQGTPWARYSTPGNKKVVVTFLWNGCKDSCEATITQSASLPNANAGADKVLTCTVTQLNLSGSSSTPNVTFSWVASAGGHIVSGGSTATPLVDQPGTYTLTVTNPTNGCAATDIALVTRNITPPNANAGADKVLTCTATQLNLSGSSSTGGATFSWAASGGGHIVSGGSTATPVVDQPGTYTLTVTNPANGCTATDVALVTRNNTAPNADAGVDKLLTCTVSQINLSGSSSTGGATFSWAASGGGHIVSGGNTATPLVDQPGTYTLTVTNPANGCTATDAALVTRNATAPNANAGPDKVLNCSVTQVNLSGSSNTPSVTFNWVASGGGHIVSGATTATPLVDQPGTYTLTVTTTATGCTATDVALVTRDVTLPNANAGPDKALTCTVTQIGLSGSSSTPGASFSWAAFGGGHIASGGTTATPAVDAAGSYVLTVSNPGNGCTAMDTAVVTKTANNAPVCHVPRDTSITTQVVPFQVCLPVSGTDIDGDVVTCEKTSGAGTLSGGQWCFTWSSPKDTSVLIGIRCRDNCDTCNSTFRVTILYRALIPPCVGNIAPVCKLPRDTTILQCIPTIVSLPVSATDANGNFKKCQIMSGPGSISSKGNWVYTPYGRDTVHVTIRCVDSCDAYCEGSFTVCFVPDNLKPICKPTVDTTIHACPSVPIMIPLYTQAIGLVDCYIYLGPGTLADGFWVYTPTVTGDVRASIRCRTVCGNTWQWALTVRVRLDGTDCLGSTITVTPGGGPATSAASSGVDPCACPRPGDVDEDGDVSVSDLAILTDVVYSKLQLASTGSCPAIAQCDVNCDGMVDHKDVAALAAYIFSQGTPLCDPCKNRTTGSWTPANKK